MKNLNTMTNEELAISYMEGNNRAFDMLLQRTQDALFTYILFVVHDNDTANDIFQETFVKQNKEVFTNPLNLDHPILGQVLGICSALAVTSQLKPAIVMGLAVTVITAFSNVIISIIRNTIPNRIRIVVQLVVVFTGISST